MSTARIVLMDKQGRYVWDGSLRDFFRANGYGRSDAHAIVEQLRPRTGWPRCEPVTVGGGAAPAFELLLAERGTTSGL